MYSKTTLLIALFFVGLSEVANAYSDWRHIEGLPCEEASSVIQDNDGYIWIGTRLGLIRYDGYNKKVYRNNLAHPHAFSSSDIQCIDTGKDGRIFTGTFFGLNTLNPVTQDVSINHFEGDDYVKSILSDNSERLWIGTGNGLYMQTKKAEIVIFNQIPHDLILDIREDSRGDLLVVSQNHGIYRIDGEMNCTHIPGTEDIHPRAVSADPDGILWIGTERDSLYSIKDGHLCHHAGYEDFTINDIQRSSDGLLLATDNGICPFPHAPNNHILKGKNVQSLCKDREGNIWAATNAQGVFFHQNRKIQFKTDKHSFTQQTTPIISQFDVRQLKDTLLWSTIPYINAIHENEEGYTYIGTWNDGLHIIKDGKIIRHLTQENTGWLKNNSIYSFGTLDKRHVLIATWQGLYLMTDNREGAFIHHIDSCNISTMHILSTYIVNEEDIWLGLIGGIAHIEGNLLEPDKAKITIYTHVNKRGITAHDNAGELTSRHDDEGEYQLGGIFRVLNDEEGRIWACTSEPGLLLYDSITDCFRCTSEQMGILGENVHSMDYDKYGNFWMTTNYGILQMHVNKYGTVTNQHLYTQHDGLPTGYYGSTMSTRLQDGSLCFLNKEHTITLAPKNLFETPKNNTAFISDILVNNKPISECRSNDDLSDGHIYLAHNQNNILIRFTTFLFGNEKSIRYSYKLEGVDDNLQLTDMGTNSIIYNQLPPGKYILHYSTAKTQNTYEKDIDKTFTIEILQPIWWQWWAKVLYVILLLLIIYVISHNAIDKSRKKRQLELLTIEKAQQEEFYRRRMNFYVKALHEFMTPLTLMSEMVHNLHNKVRPSLQSTLFMLTNQTDRLIEVLNTIIDTKEEMSAHEILQKAKEMTQVDRDFLYRCTESVNKHLADVEYSHQIMMQEVGASHATLYRKLKAMTGMDATTYIRSIRMRAACQILANEPNIRINELAERVGYSNPRYFSTCFKKEFGVTPREYNNEQPAK